jgi:hypothetical protein
LKQRRKKGTKGGDYLRRTKPGAGMQRSQEKTDKSELRRGGEEEK